MKAIEMMLKTDLTLSEVGYCVGYESLPAFSNTFFQLTNLRPSEFKRHISGFSCAN